MATLSFSAGDKRALQPASIYTIEYLSSVHRGIIMHAKTCNATSVIEALAHAKVNFPEAQMKYGARGYRVKDSEGSYHGSDEAEC